MRFFPALRTSLGFPCGLLLLACGGPPASRPAPEVPATPGPSAAAERPAPDTEPLLDDAPAEAEPAAATRPRKRGGAAARPIRHPFDDLTAEELERRVTSAPETLGSLSVGLPNNGRLLNGVQLPQGELFEPVAPGQAYGTQETVDYLTAAVRQVHERHPGTPPLHVGHLSQKTGGYLSPHLSHQSGRDVDLGFYYVQGARWYARATEGNLDVQRTWTLVRALITEADVEMILLDRSVQRILKSHALELGEDPEWVEAVFTSRKGRHALIRHVKGHQTHLHVRFFNPLAQRGAQKVYPLLVEHRLIPPVVSYVHHVAKKGDSLIKLARIYGTTVEAIQRANGLKRTLIIAKRTYKIPRTGGPAPVSGTITVPPRLLPPFDPSDRVSRQP